MNWSSVNEFLAMGGYALYVWGSVGMTALLLGGEVLALKGRKTSFIRQHARAWRRSGKGKA